MTEVHPDYGELYKFSDHKVGDQIRYRVDGRTETGEILWVAVASILPRSGKAWPPHYWVIADGGSFPEPVLFSDVVVDS